MNVFLPVSEGASVGDVHCGKVRVKVQGTVSAKCWMFDDVCESSPSRFCGGLEATFVCVCA